MGLTDAVAAIELIEANPDRCDFAGERGDEVVSLAERALGVRFPPSYRAFVLRLGAGNVGAEEIYGVIDENFIDSGVPDGVWMTLEGREQWGLPTDLVVVYFDGGTDYYVLQTGETREDGECPLVAWRPGPSQRDGGLEVIASDFGVFLLEKAEEELS